jgi:hypothetical protein
VRSAKADINPSTNETNLGSPDTEKTDRIAFRASTGVLYGSENLMRSRPEAHRRGYIGVYNLQTAAFTRHPNHLGFSNGVLGGQNLYEISGMAFDPPTGVHYLTHVRSTAGHASLLIQVNLAAGRMI